MLTPQWTQIVLLISVDIAMRKAQSWDTLTYSIGLTIGPTLIALLSSIYSITFAVSTLMFLPFIAGLIILSLPKPYTDSKKHKHKVPNLKQVLKILWHSPALKITLLMTSGAAFSLAALPVVAVYHSEALQQGRENGAYLVTFYGVGCLSGAALLIFRPLMKDALTLLKNVGCILVTCLILVSLSSTYMANMFAYWICGVVNSVFFAVTIAARTEYSPAQGAAQIYMWVAAVKITAASLGAFVAGLLVEHLIALPLVASITILSLALLVCFVRVQKQTVDNI